MKSPEKKDRAAPNPWRKLVVPIVLRAIWEGVRWLWTHFGG